MLDPWCPAQSHQELYLELKEKRTPVPHLHKCGVGVPQMLVKGPGKSLWTHSHSAVASRSCQSIS